MLSAPLISRRGFFGLAGALGIAGAVEGFEGLFVRAWADEAGRVSYKIYVVKRWEVPLSFLDVSDAANPRSIAGAKITLTSYYNGKQKTVTTDSLGIAVVDVTDLSEPVESPDSGVPVQYAFYGTVLAECAGYRTFETGRLRIVGGEQVDAPTEPLDGRPYVQRATIDGWDIQYAKSATFASTAANRDEHEAVVKMAGGPSGASVQVGLLQESGRSYAATLSLDGSGTGSASFKGRFFSAHPEDASAAFGVDEPLLLSADIPGNRESSFVLTSCAKLEPGILDDDNLPDSSLDDEKSEPVEQNFCVTDFLNDPGEISIVPFPDDFPLLGGESFNFEGILPSWPVSVTVDPFGLLIAGVGRSGSLHRHGTKWQRDTFENSLDEYRRTKDAWRRNYDNWKTDQEIRADCFGEKTQKVGKISSSKSLNFDFQAGGMIIAKWGDRLDDASNCFEGDVQLYGIIGGSFAYTYQFVALYIPLYLRFQFSASTRATFDFGVKSPK
ncbi:MAG: carboxypeptidase regulatory-like domain-containing protein, partial [Eggerthellaceae bacterium]|nr:carboxypeptidase regulatory-like domain-containing protein [Eggerthellaceae bacterium]